MFLQASLLVGLHKYPMFTFKCVYMNILFSDSTLFATHTCKENVNWNQSSGKH